MKTYWCGWEVPFGIPDEHKLVEWPSGMCGWVSGESCKYQIWVGRVDAESEDEAWNTILGCYGESCVKIEKRWDPKPNGHGWRPGGGRFRKNGDAAE